MNAKTGFTLIELMIVVVILAVLAAIVMPQFSDQSDSSKEASLVSTLGIIRDAIELYRLQHTAYPGKRASAPGGNGTCRDGVRGTGEDESSLSWIEQMTYYTNKWGRACSLKKGKNFILGPYLQFTDIPKDPITGSNNLEIVSEKDLNMTASGTEGGWKFNIETGVFIMNHTDYDHF